MKIGQLVMLVGTDKYMPPLGSVGEIVGPLDDQGDYEVLFYHHPCPVPPGITWETQAHWLIPLDDDSRFEVTEKEEIEQCNTFMTAMVQDCRTFRTE